ncbi:uncharacterized protein LOC110101166 [Dendrobium catenatum]|uniref:uncharacterized protein LOC110101166 n=1 Tax=Dendrobium catenatum TaxID=906689 RepID=UPI0010A0BA66|nr:uncharacterized protein LOC110101166 [Dendrobium catenatum]
MVSIENKDVENLIGIDWDYCYHPSNGFSGGILVLWRRNISKFIKIDSSNQFLIGDLDIINKGTWRIGTIYGSKDVYNRRSLWNGLEPFITNELPKLIGGDFNCLLSKEDKKGGRRLTWSNNKKGADRIMERLDRILVNSIAVNYNQQLVVKHLSRVASDHFPLILKIFYQSSKGLNSVKFEDVWASYPTSYVVVKDAWKRKDKGSAAGILNAKLKRTIKALFFWSKAKLQDLGVQKNLLKEDILKLQIKEAEDGGLSEEESVLLKYKINELNSTLARLNTWWRQRSKVKWIGEGDQNSKFFYSMASARKNNNYIHSIKDNNGIIVEE